VVTRKRIYYERNRGHIFRRALNKSGKGRFTGAKRELSDTLGENFKERFWALKNYSRGVRTNTGKKGGEQTCSGGGWDNNRGAAPKGCQVRNNCFGGGKTSLWGWFICITRKEASLEKLEGQRGL